MRKLLLILFVVACATPAGILGQNKSELLERFPGIGADINNSLEGREFILAIPPNEANNIEILQRALEIYVSSRFDTEVTVSVPGLGVAPISKQVKAGEAVTFSTMTDEISWAYEVRESDLVSDKGIIVSAHHPISVRVLSGKGFSSEGYAARPLMSWSTRYSHLGYYDYPELQSDRGGGFVVVAQEDATSVIISVDGTSSGGTTAGGKRIGQRFNITLNRGQVYMLRGSGLDRVFDLSGSAITANKPIGVIAFHERTIIPTAMGTSSRDNLMEMLPPTIACGTEHHSIDFPRENKGDYFRVLALEPETRYEVRYYDTSNERALIGVRNGFLSNGGDWAEFEEVNPQGGAESIRGTAKWTSDNPTMVMQYAYSSEWDGNADYDPMMQLVPPVEQFAIGGVTVLTPLRAEYNNNLLTIVAQLPPDTSPEEGRDLLQTITIDGLRVAALEPKFLINRIPETDLHWARINIQPGYHNLESPLPVATSLHGLSQFENYAWTGGFNCDQLRTGDQLAPSIVLTSTDGTEYEVRVQDLGTPAVGISAVELIGAESQNVSLTYLTDLTQGGEVAQAQVRLTKTDPDAPAFALLLARDRAGNVSIREFTMDGTGPQLQVSAEPFFAAVGGQGCNARGIRLTNSGTQELLISSIQDISGLFEHVGTQLNLPFVIGPSATVYYGPICFKPVEEGVFEQTVTISSNDAESANSSVILRGSTDLTTSVSALPAPFGALSLSPNPASKSVHLQWSNFQLDGLAAGQLQLQVFDARGIEQLSRSLHVSGPGTQNAELDVRSLPAGSYFLILRSGQYTLSQPLQVMR